MNTQDQLTKELEKLKCENKWYRSKSKTSGIYSTEINTRLNKIKKINIKLNQIRLKEFGK
jgi:hypothetical protein